MFHEKGMYGELVIYLSEHRLVFMKRHVWRVSYFFIKRLTKIEISLCFMKKDTSGELVIFS